MRHGRTIVTVSPAPTVLRRRRQALVQAARRGTSAADVFARASERLRRIVPFDAAAWLGTDPGTGLPTAPVRIEDLDGISRRLCAEHWQRELLVDDVNLFRDLGRAPVPAAGLRDVTGDPARSPRFRRFLRPLGLDDELRTVLRAGDASWGTVTLWRRRGRPSFTAAETALLAGLSAPLGEALRHHARPARGPTAGRHHGPGLLLFDAAGDLVSINDDAKAWLDELPPEPGVTTDLATLPVWMLITMYRASAIRQGAGDGTARTRVRSRTGRWLVCHASCLRAADGSAGPTALVIEPAQPAAVAPIVVEAYDLTEREQEVIAHVARGTSTADMAAELHLSPHTVRDHLKAIFAKVGVSSRGELTATLFAEFYEPLHAADVTRARS
jgi:DNA-binding CsgD family transcriptional regulator